MLKRKNAFGRSREAVLASCFVILIASFGVTAAVARTYHKRIHTLADEWYAGGEAALAAKQNEDAVTDFRNALVYSPNNSLFQFHLAEALMAAHRWDDAADYLQNLLSETPGSGEINLALARIAAQKNSLGDAMRYYQSAIYGEWQQNPIAMRWNTRYEMCEFLLAHHDTNDADAAVIALADNTGPRDVMGLDAAGKLLLYSQLWDRALAVFRMALVNSRHDPDALAGAGQAAFELGQYATAAEYLERLPKEKREEADIAPLLDLSRQVQASDPFLDGLSVSERARRASAALSAAESRLEACGQSQGLPATTSPPVTDLQKLYASAVTNRREWSQPALAAHPDRIEAAMTAVFQMEASGAQHCGEPKSGPDAALRLIANERRNASQ